MASCTSSEALIILNDVEFDRWVPWFAQFGRGPRADDDQHPDKSFMGLAFCLLAFVATLLFSWRSALAGLGAVLTTGYLFGITRANYPDSFSHFIFDSAVLGFFASYFGGGGFKNIIDPTQQTLQRWTFFLIGWAVLMFLVPMQHPIIQLVGLRGNAFMLPFLLVGGRLSREDAMGLAMWLSALNHLALAFAVAEYLLGVPAFFPENVVTEIIYRSKDVAGTSAFRIPATFSNSASFGSTMAITVPWLLGAWIQPRLVDWQRGFLVSGIVMAMVGVFLCASRQPVVMLAVIAIAATLSGKLRGAVWIVWSVVILGVGYIVLSENRMQRFLSLQDTDLVMQRIEGSVNMTFLDLLITYPFGNGLGAGGTSIPFFLQHLVKDPVLVENEYGRILLEQGAAGLVLWLAFIVWILGRRPSDPRDSWLFGKQLLWLYSLAIFGTVAIGTGLMTSIPQSMLIFLGIGFFMAPAFAVRRKEQKGHSVPAQLQAIPAPIRV
jgi:hypothetical protein